MLFFFFLNFLESLLLKPCWYKEMMINNIGNINIGVYYVICTNICTYIGAYEW